MSQRCGDYSPQVIINIINLYYHCQHTKSGCLEALDERSTLKWVESDELGASNEYLQKIIKCTFWSVF